MLDHFSFFGADANEIKEGEILCLLKSHPGFLLFLKFKLVFDLNSVSSVLDFKCGTFFLCNLGFSSYCF